MPTDWENYNSGPYCKHWSDPSDCEEICAKCGKACHAHNRGEAEDCDFFDEYSDNLKIMEDSIKEKK